MCSALTECVAVKYILFEYIPLNSFFFYLEKTLMEHLQLKWGRYAHLGRVPEFNILVSIFKHLLVVEK